MGLAGGDGPIIFLNYAVDPNRRSRHMAALACDLGGAAYVFADALAPDDAPRVRILVNKTRELSDGTLTGFPNLRGICLQTTEDWMLTFDRASAPIRVGATDVDRGTDVAEVALMLMLVGLKLAERPRWHSLRSPGRLYRRLFPSAATETAGGHNWTAARTRSAYRKRVGIVGYGLIGREIHRRVEAFGAEVLYHHRRRFSDVVERRLRMTYRDLPELFRECDVIFVQLPLTEKTRALVGEPELALAKPHLVLVNCGRAAVVDKPALERALGERRIGFYGADVFWREPMPLWDRFRFLSNVFVTPHLSESVTDAPSHERAVARALGALVGDLNGR